MKLTLTGKMPPGGYQYKEPAIEWEAPRELALTSADAVAKALSKAREQNPSAGLDASLSASYDAVVQAVYERFKGLPSVLKRYVQVTQGEAVARMPALDATGKPRVRAIKAGGGGCASCGGARRLRKV